LRNKRSRSWDGPDRFRDAAVYRFVTLSWSLLQYASIMRTAVLVMLIYAAADTLPLDKEIGTGEVATPEVKQKVTTRSRVPYIGPKPFLSKKPIQPLKKKSEPTPAIPR
jgi:hypothetical protein